MKVVVTGATGNVGTSAIEALRRRPEVEEIVGLARRRPSWRLEGVDWVVADVVGSELEPLFEGAGAVIHLAWAIQPSRDAVLLERINVEGSRRVFEAAARAGVPKLVHASSVGAYSPGSKDTEVDESWPVGGIESSFYSRHKAAAERLLDQLGERHPEIEVARLRPALIFKGEAASEIRRLFAGPFLPTFLIGSPLLPALPRIDGLRFQAVHSADVGEAYARAATGPARGPFNLAAGPPLDSERLAAALGVRTVPLAASLARRLIDLSWRLRLQPSPPGWLDMALGTPLISSERARAELGWEPRFSAEEALGELLEGMREGRGHPTPPLREDGMRSRIEELRTGVGARPWPRDRNQQLLSFLADVHSIERQALTQMEAAPEIAGEERLAAIFERHREETEGHVERVRERLEAHGARPSTLKDLAGRGGGAGMVLFARLQPETPGKLLAHAYSYEHMELAAYELLGRVAEQAGDEATAAVARRNGEEERRMAERIAEHFDLAVELALDGSGEEEVREQLLTHLADLHAIERQAEQLLRSGPKLSADEELAGAFATHLEETREQRRRLERRLRALGGSPSVLKDAALRAGALNLSAFLGLQPDTTTKLAGFAYAFEHLEIAAYELLKRVAERAGEAETVGLVEQALREERNQAERIAATWSHGEIPRGAPF